MQIEKKKNKALKEVNFLLGSEEANGNERWQGV